MYELEVHNSVLYMDSELNSLTCTELYSKTSQGGRGGRYSDIKVMGGEDFLGL